MTCIATTIKNAVRNGKRLFWGLRNIRRDTTIAECNNSILISLINKVHQNRRFCKDFLLYNYLYLDGNWISIDLIRCGYLTTRESQLVWANRSELPRWLLDDEPWIKELSRQYAARGFIPVDVNTLC